MISFNESNSYRPRKVQEIARLDEEEGERMLPTAAMEDQQQTKVSTSSVEVDQQSQQVDTTCNHENDQTAEERSSSNTSPLGQPQTDNCDQVSSRQKKINKMKLLVRSHALREAASPPPDSPSPQHLENNDSSTAAAAAEQYRQSQKTPLVITVVGSDDDTSPEQETTAHVTSKNRLRPRVQVESSQCSVDSSSSFVSFSLSRDSSAELTNGSDAFISVGSHSYTDNTGVDLQHFIEETLHRNYKDRMTLLRIEQDMIALVRDTKRTCHRFPAMSSYHRMLVHRVAAFFGMEHNVDQSGNCVVVSKSRHTRLPDVAFKEYVRDDIVLPEEPNRKLNSKRETVSFDEQQVSSGRYGRSPEARSRSLDVAEPEIALNAHRPRNRALQPQVTWVSSADGIPGLALGARSKENLTDSTYGSVTLRPEEIQSLRWNKRFSQGTRHHRVPKVESFDSRELLGSYGNTLRPTVAKSYSFGGYTPVADAETTTTIRVEPVINGVPAVYPHVITPGQNQNYSSRFLSKQDSNSSSISISRSSPTSSGYKSQHSAATSPTPVNRLPPRAPGIVSCVSSSSSAESPNGHQEWAPRGSTVSTASGSEVVTTTPANTTLLWAVTSLDAVPPGSVLINPQTGQPFYNPDGSAYRYDPNLPLPFQVEAGNANPDVEAATEDTEQPESFEGSDHAAKEDQINEAIPVASVPVYQNWQQNSYETPQSPVYPVQPATYFNAEYTSFHNGATSHHPSNGFYVAGPAPVNAAASFDDHMKANCVAVPVAQGNGYVLYQTCLGGDNGGASIDNELYSVMKNLSLRPLGAVPNMSYPTVVTENMSVPTDMVSTTPFMTAVPIRPMTIANTKMSATGVSLPNRSGSTPPVAVPCTVTSSTASNPYLSSIRVHSSGQVMHHQVQPYNGTANLAATYHPSMVYPVMNAAPHQQMTRQHYYPSANLVHQLNNSQFVSSPWLMTAPATNRGTPERDLPVRVDSPVNRMVANHHSPSRLSCFYGPSLPSPYHTGDGGGIRHSPNAMHRQFSLPSSSGPPNMYTLRPRIQQQQLPTAVPGSPLQRPQYSSVQNNQGALPYSSRHACTARRQVFRPHAGTGVSSVVDSSSIMPLQNCSFSHVQHFPSPSC